MRRRFGYRRLHVLLDARGHRHEPQEAAPALPRGAAAGAPARRPQAGPGHTGADGVPQGPNQRWSLDFLSDALTDGRRFRILAIVDDFTRECLALVADTSLSGLRVARELDAVIARRGRPAMIVSDNGTELTSMAILRWSQEPGRVALHRARQAAAECLRRELQRPTARRAVERDAVQLARSCSRGAAALEGRLQHRPPAQRARQSAASRLRQNQRSRNATGRDAALH